MGLRLEHGICKAKKVVRSKGRSKRRGWGTISGGRDLQSEVEMATDSYEEGR